jgi:hypothetical protein
MEVLDDRTAPEVEEILAESAIASASSLPLTNMCMRMFDCHPLSQLGTSLRGQLRWRNSVSNTSPGWILPLRPC